MISSSQLFSERLRARLRVHIDHSGQKMTRLVLWQRVTAYWLISSTILTILCVAVSLALLPQRRTAENDGVIFNLITLGCALALNIATARWARAQQRKVFLAALLLPLITLSVLSGNIVALGTVVALLMPMFWLGREVVHRLNPEIETVEAWMIGSGLGIGSISAIGFVLGSLGLLRPLFVWSILIVTVSILAAVSHKRLRSDLRHFKFWLRRAYNPEPVYLLSTTIILACYWLNLLGSLAPEMRSDAIRQRLVAAIQFAENGTIFRTQPDLLVARDPAFGEIAYAVSIAIGPTQSAKLINFILSISCALAIFVLGRRLYNVRAGVIALVTFSSTLLMSYLSQTAYLDLFTILFAVIAVLCLAIDGEPTRRYSLTICAGMLLGYGVATKLHFAYIAIGVAIMAVGFSIQAGKRQVTSTILILTTSALLAAAPWLLRSAFLTNSIPGLSLSLGSIGDNQSQIKGDLVNFGFGRSFLQLLLAPFTATFLSGKFGGTQVVSGIIGGHAGFAAFCFLPLVLISRRNKYTTALFVGAIGAALLWFFTAQYLRYALPIGAFLAVLTGISYATIRQRIHSRQQVTMLNTVLIILLCAGMAIRIQLPDMAHRFAFGLQSQEEFLAEWMGGQAAGTYEVTKLLNAEPHATRVLASYDGARLYSRVRISQPWSTGGDLIFEGSPDEVWTRLEAGGYSHILLDRSVWQGDNWFWDRMTVINEDFLRCNTELVGGGHTSYLYRLLPPDERGCKQQWARGAEIISDGGFESIAESSTSGWSLKGSPKYDTSGTQSREGRGAVSLSGEQAVFTTVTIAGGTKYLLAQATRTAQSYGRVSIQIEWQDAEGKVLGKTGEEMPVSPRKYHTFSMLTVAPNGAAKAIIYAKALSGTVWLDDFSMKTVDPDMARR